MLRFSDILRKHGIKLWLSNLVGSLAVGFVGGIILVFFILAFLIVGGATLAGTLPQGMNLENLTTEEIDRLFGSLFSSPGTWVFLVIFLIIGAILYLIIESFKSAGSVSVALQAVMENESDIATYFNKGFKYMVKIFLVLLLSSLAYLVPGLLLGIGIVAASANSVIIGTLLVLIGIVGFFALGLAFMHAPYILISEDTDVINSLKKSIQLFTKAFGRVFGSAFFAALIVFAIMIVLVIIGFILGLIAGGSPDNLFVPIVMQIIQMVLNLIFSPMIITLITLVVAYRYHKYLRPLIVHVEAEPASPLIDNPDVSFSFKKNPTEEENTPPSSNQSFEWDEPSSERKDDD
ncbi:MAG: hypothetical protein WBZ33_03040 [Thermoactinomyces sp.]